MRNLVPTLTLLLPCALLAFGCASSSGSQSPEAAAKAAKETDQSYADAVEMFRTSASGSFFEDCYGYAVFPTVGKGGVIAVGASAGKGRVYVKGRHVGNAKIGEVSIGPQLGGQAFSQIVFFQDERAFTEFSNGNFEFGANAEAVAITAGVSASATTAGSSATASGGSNNAVNVGEYRKGFAVFTIAKGGLMYEISIAGQGIKYEALGSN